MTNLNEGLITPCTVSIKKTRHLSDEPKPPRHHTPRTTALPDRVRPRLTGVPCLLLQRAATQAAGRIAGLTVERIINEVRDDSAKTSNTTRLLLSLVAGVVSVAAVLLCLPPSPWRRMAFYSWGQCLSVTGAQYYQSAQKLFGTFRVPVASRAI